MSERDREQKRADIAVEREEKKQEAQDRQQQKIKNGDGEQEPKTEQEKRQKDFEQQAKQTLDKIEDIAKETAAPAKESSAKRSQQAGNPHPVPPEERTLERGASYRAAADTAVGAIGAARANIENQLATDKRIQSDPRYERDQKVYEMGQAGKLGLVPPSEAEVIAAAAKSGVPPEALEKLPSTPEEQAEDDMERLEKGEKRAEAISPAQNSQDKETRAEADKQNQQRQQSQQEKKSPEPPKGQVIK